MQLNSEYIINQQNADSLFTDFPIIVKVPSTVWEDFDGWRSIADKYLCAKQWVHNELKYPEYHLRHWYGYSNYVVIRFKNISDALYFQLTWC